MSMVCVCGKHIMRRIVSSITQHRASQETHACRDAPHLSEPSPQQTSPFHPHQKPCLGTSYSAASPPYCRCSSPPPCLDVCPLTISSNKNHLQYCLRFAASEVGPFPAMFYLAAALLHCRCSWPPSSPPAHHLTASNQVKTLPPAASLYCTFSAQPTPEKHQARKNRDDTACLLSVMQPPWANESHPKKILKST